MDKKELQLDNEYLTNNHWKPIDLIIDPQTLIKLDPGTVIEETGELLSNLGESLSKNWLSIFSKKTKGLFRNYVKALTSIPSLDNLTGVYISGKSKPDLDSFIPDEAFSSLKYKNILDICTSLGSPNRVWLYTANDIYQLDLNYFVSVEQLNMPVTYLVSWPNVNLKITYDSYDQCQVFTLYFDNLNELRGSVNKVVSGLAINLKKKSFDLGTVNPEYPLDSFPDYIQSFTEVIKKEMFKEDYPFFNLLIKGPVGTGKTKWTLSYASEVLAPRGYLILIVDYSTLEDLVIPEQYNKVCVIINDADTLCLDRSISNRGETEKVLEWLDNTRSTFIKPFGNIHSQKSVINLLTANSTDQWDEAGLRKGRIHYQYIFDQSLV